MIHTVGNPETIVGLVPLELVSQCCHLVPDHDDDGGNVYGELGDTPVGCPVVWVFCDLGRTLVLHSWVRQRLTQKMMIILILRKQCYEGKLCQPAQEPENVHDCDQKESYASKGGVVMTDDDEEVDLYNHDGGGDVTVGGGEGKALVF